MTWQFSLCALHALRCFGEQGWQFFVPIALAFAFPGTLFPAVATQTAQTIGRLCLAPKVALWYAGQASPRKAYFTILIADLVAVGGFGSLLSLGTTHLVQSQKGFMLCFLMILASGISGIDASLSTVLGLVVSKNWTAELAQNAAELAKANSMVTICELLVAAATPLVISSVSSFCGHAAATGLLMMYQLTATFVIMLLAHRLSKKLKISPGSMPEEAPQEGESLSFRCILIKWWELPGNVRGAMLALIVLFCTVLGGASAGLTSWYTLQGVSVARIALWTSSMNFIGFIGASVSPFAIRMFGPFRAARIGQGWQMCFVLAGLVAFLCRKTELFMIAIPLSRVGLWCFDLAERQIIQSAVPEHLLAPFFAAEASVQQCFFLLMLVISLALPRPSQFVILVVISASVTVIACIILHVSAHCESVDANIDSATLLSAQEVELGDCAS